MKKFMLALVFSLCASSAWAQCTGVFPPQTLCGNLTNSPAPPGPVPAAPPQFFWAATGSDANDCKSAATACQTIARFNSYSFTANGTINFNGGDTFTGTLVIPSSNLTIQSYGTGQAKISSGASGACATLTNLHDVTINNISCIGAGVATNTTDGIVILNNLAGNTVLANITVNGSTITGYGANGVKVYSANALAGFSNVNITNNLIHDVSGNFTAPVNSTNFLACVQIATDPVQMATVHSNVSVKNNTIYNCTGTATSNVGSGNGVVIGMTNTGTISNNLIHDYAVNNSFCGGAGAAWTYNSHAITIQFNEAYNGHKGTGGGACDGGGLDIDGNTDASIMQYNYVHDVDSFGVFICGCSDGGIQGNYSPFNNNNTARFNLVVNSGVGIEVLSADQTVTNAKIYNNTIIGAGANAAIKMLSNPGSITITAQVSNNIFYNVSGLQTDITLPGSSVINLQGNSYFDTSGTLSIKYAGTTYSTLAAFQAIGQEKVSSSPVGISSDPTLVSYQLAGSCNGVSATCPVGLGIKSGSPALPNAGLNLSTNFSINPGTQDFYGHALTAATLPIGGSSVAAASTGGTTTWGTFNAGGSLSNGSLSFNNPTTITNWLDVLANSTGHSSGKYYAEFTTDTNALGDTNTVFGISTTLPNGSTNFPGHDATSVGAFITPGTGVQLFTNSAGPAIYSYPFTRGATFQMAVDMSANLFWVNVDNGNWNGSPSANPATGTGGFSFSLGAAAFPVAAMKHQGIVTANFGAFGYHFTPPGGFGNW
jgi:hypothetical protein